MKRVEFIAGTAATLALGGPAFAAAATSSLTVYHVANDVSTLIAITPAKLPNFPGVRVHHVTDAAAIAKAMTAVGAAHATPATSAAHGIDARWALVFARNGRVTHQYFTNRFGTDAVVDGERSQFARGAALVTWLASNYGPA